MNGGQKIPWVWTLMVGAVCTFLALGCSSRTLNYSGFSRDLQSPDPCVRIRAILYAGNSKDKRAIPLLVDRLEDEDEAVRMATIASLQQLTDQDFGYRSYDPPYVRAKAVDRWRQWLRDQTTTKVAGDSTRK